MTMVPDTPAYRWYRAKDAMAAEAVKRAQAGEREETIVAALMQAFPGLRSENDYRSTANQAIAKVIRERDQVAQGRGEDLARLRKKGLPASLADRQASPPDLPCWTTCVDDPDWRGPLHTEVEAAQTGGELLDLCRRYGLTITYDRAAGALVLGKRIAPDSPLWARLGHLKPRIVRLLTARGAVVGGTTHG